MNDSMVAANFSTPRTIAGGITEFTHKSGRSRVLSSKGGRVHRVERTHDGKRWDPVFESQDSGEAFFLANCLAGSV